MKNCIIRCGRTNKTAINPAQIMLAKFLCALQQEEKLFFYSSHIAQSTDSYIDYAIVLCWVVVADGKGRILSKDDEEDIGQRMRLGVGRKPRVFFSLNLAEFAKQILAAKNLEKAHLQFRFHYVLSGNCECLSTFLLLSPQIMNREIYLLHPVLCIAIIDIYI